ncbi:uroporphyrinogen-III C-methyltransferase [Ferrimonas aestuarii]|uniref:uroporphyrinogen-III C-methyltransferase n=1 Tax=Ferrimonas aestuarii TaxID=2569539 RepID=A0A4U1BFY7_9GAMM|nr:uroporphyrinogen-III C-methyltransferase [Ferrimonas aestuarii]TKB50049.1 uroporphyrinogen-III C-methyltransferase [Ferrimonas aestuarii]
MSDQAMAPGRVFLVGAGPGDPGLLTQRALELMHHCDVICYDLLVSDAILAQIPQGKTLIPVGYRGYCGTSIEYGMHPDVVAQALAGHEVLRLKAGDPFIFGRGTEECLCLQYHGIDYQVIPGISASLGAAAYTGFPLTSNGMASDVTFASGHKASTTISNWAALGQGSGTLVLYMGAKKIALHAQELISQGKPADTPLAVIAAATSTRHRVMHSTLAKAGQEIAEFDNGDPMLVVIGDVVTLADKLDWRSKLPLSGVQILACTEHRQLIEPLKLAGAIVIEPVTRHVTLDIEDGLWQQLMSQFALHLMDRTSAEALLAACRHRRLDLRDLPWALTAEGDGVTLLAEQGVFVESAAQEGAMVIQQHTKGVAINYDYDPVNSAIKPASRVLVDDCHSLIFLISNQLLATKAVVMSQCTEVLELAQELGFVAESMANHDECAEKGLQSVA